MTDNTDYVTRMAKAISEATNAVGDMASQIVQRTSTQAHSTGVAETFKDNLVESLMSDRIESPQASQPENHRDEQELGTLARPDTPVTETFRKRMEESLIASR